MVGNEVSLVFLLSSLFSRNSKIKIVLFNTKCELISGVFQIKCSNCKDVRYLAENAEMIANKLYSLSFESNVQIDRLVISYLKINYVDIPIMLARFKKLRQ